MKKIISVILSLALVFSMANFVGIKAEAVASYSDQTSWFATDGTGNPHQGSNWTFMYGKYGEFQKMEYRGNLWGEKGIAVSSTDWQTRTTGWQMYSTKDNWNAVAYSVAADGNVTGGNHNFQMNGDGNGCLMVVLKSGTSGTFYPVYPTAGSWTWETVSTAKDFSFTTGVKAGDTLYYVVKPTNDSSTTSDGINLTPGVNFTAGTPTNYPTNFQSWPMPDTTYDGPSWFISSGSSNPHPGSNWSFMYGKDGNFSLLPTRDGNMWKVTADDWTGVKPYGMVANKDNWMAQKFAIPQTGLLTSKSVESIRTEGNLGGDFMVVLQNGETGRFYPVYPTAGSWTWDTIPTTTSDSSPHYAAGKQLVNFPVEKGDTLYYVVKPTGTNDAGAVCFNPDITIGSRKTDSPSYPTNVQWMEWGVTENKTTNIGWAVQQPSNPSVNTETGKVDSLYSWYYFDTADYKFNKMTYQADSPSFYQDETGSAKIQGWQLLATNEKYAAIAVTAQEEASVQLTSDTTLTTSFADGEFMLLQKSGNVYSVLLDWVSVPSGQSVKVPNVKAHLKAGEQVYYIYRSTSSTQVLFNQASLPSAIYGAGGTSTTGIYPTSWVTLAHIFGNFQDVLTGMSMSLDSEIAVNFYIDTTKTFNANAYIEFEVPGEEVQKVMISDAETGDYGKKIPCYVPAKNMQDQVIASVFDNGELIDAEIVSIRNYADAVMEEDVTTEMLMKTMLTYGAYAQKAFKYNEGNLANKGYEDADEVSTVKASELAGYAFKPQSTSGLGSLVGAHLVLEGKTAIALYFNIESGVTPTFTCNGKTLNAVNAGNGMYVVKVEGIDARELNEDYTVVVTGNGKTLNAKCSAFTYCYAALNSALDENWKNLVKAIYLYNLYTEAYYGEYIDSSRLVVNRDLYYGICYLAYQDQQWYGGDASQGIAAMSNLGAKTTRLWMNATDIMDNPSTFNWKLSIIKDIVAETQSNGIEIIGMQDLWFDASGSAVSDGTVPTRNLTEGSDYMEFLENYETMWYSLAKKFPEITYWEIGNEYNEAGKFHPASGEFTDVQKAQIIADMLYHASRGIHEANPRALTVMGGLIEVWEENYNNIGDVLQDIYNEIGKNTWGTTDADDFFQIAAWHPYEHSGNIDNNWVSRQKQLYKIITDYEKHDKVVIFTEIGFSNYYNDPSTGQGVWDGNRYDDVLRAYNTTASELPFVQSICYFRLFNTVAADESDYFESYFGLLTAPTYNKDSSGNVTSYSYYIKESGVAFQNLTGSTYDFPREN